MEEKKNKWVMPVAIGCVVILCLCVLVIGGTYFLARDTFNDLMEQVTGQTDPGGLLTDPGNDPSTDPGTDSGTDPGTDSSTDPGTGFTDATEAGFFDDFSNPNSGWSEFNDGSTIIQYENGAYSIELIPADYIDWTYVPVNFFPTSIQFDVRGMPGQQNGTLGVNCNYLDENNHYYAEFDLYYQEVTIGLVRDGYYEDVYAPDAEGLYWKPLSYMNTPPESFNTIMVECTQSEVSVWVNGQFEYSFDMPNPFTSPGEMALFVYTYAEGTGNYKVFFDNVTVE